jgi:cell division protein FtsB
MLRHKFDLVVMMVCLALLGYFGWHGYYGPRSFGHRDNIHAKAVALEEKLAAIRTEREQRETRVQLMRPESVDPDLLDELARQELEYAKPGDLILRRWN